MIITAANIDTVLPGLRATDFTSAEYLTAIRTAHMEANDEEILTVAAFNRLTPEDKKTVHARWNK